MDAENQKFDWPKDSDPYANFQKTNGLEMLFAGCIFDKRQALYETIYKIKIPLKCLNLSFLIFSDLA